MSEELRRMGKIYGGWQGPLPDNRTPRKSSKRCVLVLNFAYLDFFFKSLSGIPPNFGLLSGL